jgi:hypothetical protein
LSFQLFDVQELEALKQMIRSVEELVFTSEQLAIGYSLYDLEMAIESNPDYYAYFEREDTGTTVSKFDVERELNKIRLWIFERVREKAQSRRFSRFR